ncbi:MAG: alpha/beta fold hydrolase [Dehalococcoidia bacterium]
MRSRLISRRWGVAVLAAGLFLLGAYATVSLVVVQQALVAEAHAFEYLPEDLGLAYETVEFRPRSDEDITLRGWWLAAADARATVIWVHGLDGTRASRLPLLQDLVARGFNVLTFDLRGHGASDKALMGAGLHEQSDLQGAIDYALDERDVASGTLFLMGSSFGAAVTLLVGPDEPAVAGVYADSAFANLGDMITAEVAKRTVLPLFGAKLLKPGLVMAGRIFRGIDLSAVRPVDAAARYRYPIGIAHCETDERIPYSHGVAIGESAPSGSPFETYACEHANGYDAFPEQYTGAVVAYLDSRLAGAPASAVER